MACLFGQYIYGRVAQSIFTQYSPSSVEIVAQLFHSLHFSHKSDVEVDMAVESTQFVFPIQGASTLRQLNSMRLDGLLTDVTIVTDNRESACHRAVLAASCPYFKAMFSHGLRECFEHSVTLHGVEHRALELVLQYVYMGTCIITKLDAPALLTAADLLGLIPLRDAAAKFLQRCIDVRNCLQICQLADEHSCENLRKMSLDFARTHFTDVTHQANFLKLNVRQVTSYLDDDELQVAREDVIFDAAMKWIRHDPANRGQHMEEVLESVRLPFVKPEYLKLQATVDPLIYHNETCIRQVLEARTFQISGEFRRNFLGKQRKPRKCASKQVLVVFGGVSQNGDHQKETRDIITYEPSFGKWGRLGEIPESLNVKAFASASLGYEIIITGGVRENKALNDVIIFYTYLNQWCPSSPLVHGRYHHACTVVDGCVFAVGGTDGRGCLHDVEVLDNHDTFWREVCPLPHAVKCPAMTSYNKSIYVFGGFTDTYVMSQTVQIYSTRTDTWTITSSPWVDYACAHAVVTSSKIYLLGGSSRNMKIFDPATDQWGNGPPMLEKRDNCSVTSVGEKLFVSGGLNQSAGPSLGSVECYCPRANAWNSVDPMATPLHRHQSVCVRIPIYEREHPGSSSNTDQQPRSSTEIYQHPESPSKTNKHPGYRYPTKIHQHPGSSSKADKHPGSLTNADQQPRSPTKADQHPGSPRKTGHPG